MPTDRRVRGGRGIQDVVRIDLDRFFNKFDLRLDFNIFNDNNIRRHGIINFFQVQSLSVFFL